MRDYVRFHLNDEPHTVRGEAMFAPFTDTVRTLGLTGTKVVCAEGDCGACTVLVDNRPVDSCIQFLYQLDGTRVLTVEGLGDELHPAQEAMIACHGSQCGYCTPGFVMALAGWADAGGDLRTALTGNLCRCTGYVPILEAAATLGRTQLPRHEPSGDAGESLRLTDGRRSYFAPTSLPEALAYKAEHPHAVIVAGGTELGVWRNKRGDDPTTLLSLARVPGLDCIALDGGRMHIGANVTWSAIERELVPRLPAFAEIVRRFGSPQIRNAATLAGNLVNGSPIADALPLLMVLEAELTLASAHGSRQRPLNGFYTGYKTKDLAAEEILTQVAFDFPHADERLRLYKVARRNDLDIATVGAAFRLNVAGGVITRAAIAYSGMAATVLRSPEIERTLVGRPFEERTFDDAAALARTILTPLTDVRGSQEYRRELAARLLQKFFAEETL